MHTPPVVSPEAWKEAHQQLLVKEKAHSRARDALASERRRMPWMDVKTDYAFDGLRARPACSTCSTGRRQLILYRAFYEPGGVRLARPCLPGLLHGGRPGSPMSPI